MEKTAIMPPRVVLVHDDPRFVREATAALRAATIEVAAFTDPLAALNAVEAAQTVELLVTRVRFPLGKPNGVSLVRVARNKRPDMKALFLSLPEYAERVMGEGLGACMVAPVQVPDLVAAVRRLLTPDDQKEGPPPFTECQ